MKLYATTTSERATKGQGGQWLDIEITAEKQDLAIISVREESNNYLISIIANPERKKQEIWIPKGEKQKGEKGKQCDKCGRYMSDIDYANYNGKCPFDCSY